MSSTNQSIQENEDTIYSELIGWTGGNISNDFEVDKEESVIKQLDENLKQQLSDHTWGIISYNPLRFMIAHRDYRQIIHASVKKENIKSSNASISSSEVWSVNLSKIIIGAIPLEVTRHENPLGLSSEHTYSIKFETQANQSFTMKAKNLEEIVAELKDRALIFISNKSLEALSIIIGAFEKEKKIVINRDLTSEGFYFIENKIKMFNTEHPNPTSDQTRDCIDLLETLQSEFKNKSVLPTIIRWTICAPFNFVIKQRNGKWLPWLYLYGFPRTGKTSLGDISCATWGHFLDDKYKIPFTNVDTVAKLGEALSQGTYPIAINEAGGLSDDNKSHNKNLIEMIKTAIEGSIARSKFVNKTHYTEIPSYCACILTSNSAPPSDLGFRRRIIAVNFTQHDEYSSNERKDFESLLTDKIRQLKILGDFVANYILNNQTLLLDGKSDWKEISKTIISKMYESVGKKMPDWIDNIIEDDELEESKEELHLVLRGYLLNKINDIYNKFNRSRDEQPAMPISVSTRLEFCLSNKLIPYMNHNEKSELIITSDFILELRRNRIDSISSLAEVGRMINGFEYGQKKVAGKNVRSAYGSKNNFLEFLN